MPRAAQHFLFRVALMFDVALMFQVTDYLHSVFAKRKSPNKLKVTMVIGAKPWLADTQHALYEAGKAAVKRGTTTTLRRLRPCQRNPPTEIINSSSSIKILLIIVHPKLCRIFKDKVDLKQIICKKKKRVFLSFPDRA